MTEPQQSQSDLSVWHVPGRTPLILYAQETCEHIVAAAFTSLRRSGGEDESGGILFGGADDDEVKIVASRPFPRESGGAFSFAAEDHAGMQRMIQSTASDPDLRKLVPVGFYRARIGGELALSDSDIEIWNRHFPFRWQIVLLLRIEEGVPVRAGFFFRPAKGVARVDAPLKEFELDAPPVPKPAASEHLPVHLPRELFRIPNERGPGRAKWYALGALAALGAMGAGYQVAKFSPREPEPGARLRLVEHGVFLTAQWDRDSPALKNLRNGHLVISDGTRSLGLLPLSDSRLASGSFQIVRSSEDVRVKIVGTGPSGERVVVETARFAGPLSVPEPADSTADLETETSAFSALRRDLDGRLRANRALETQLERAVRQAQAGARDRTPAPDPRPPEPAPPKPVQTAQAPPASSPPALPPPQPVSAEVQIPQPEPALYSGPTSGRIIWTGHLPPNSTLTINARSPSAGSVSGALPPVAARVSVYAAEITGTGLSLFTSNAARANATEARSARSGWMTATFVYDTARAQDARLAEPPSERTPQRIVIRSGERPLSAAVIDWQVAR